MFFDTFISKYHNPLLDLNKYYFKTSLLPLPVSDVSSDEIGMVESMLSMLHTQHMKDSQHVADLDEDAVCDICYARAKSVRFSPCGHQSCKWVLLQVDFCMESVCCYMYMYMLKYMLLKSWV